MASCCSKENGEEQKGFARVKSSALGNKLKLATFVCLGAAVIGCETARVIIEPKPQADFSQFHSFAVLPVIVPENAKDNERVAKLAQMATDTANVHFIVRGYREEPTNSADLLIEIEGQAKSRNLRGNASVTHVQTAYGSVPVAGSFEDDATNDERSVRVRAYDARTRELLWTGAAIKVTAVAARPKDVEKAVRRIVERFPIAVAATNQP